MTSEPFSLVLTFFVLIVQVVDSLSLFAYADADPVLLSVVFVLCV